MAEIFQRPKSEDWAATIHLNSQNNPNSLTISRSYLRPTLEPGVNLIHAKLLYTDQPDIAKALAEQEVELAPDLHPHGNVFELDDQ